MKLPLAVRLALTVIAATASAAAPTILRQVPYKTGDGLSVYERERCQLDLYLPTNTAFATLVWFHGGGLTGGNKASEEKLGRMFAREGIALAVPNYRLSPQVHFPAYIEDAAAAVAWTQVHVAEHHGDPKKVFVGGHSAGGYLTAMLAMNPAYLRQVGTDPNTLAGLLPVSGQMMTHFTVRHERGLGTNAITADDAAPIFFTRPDVPPMLILMGDHDWPARVEENQYFVALQKVAGNRRIHFLQIPDRDHGSIAGRIPEAADPAGQAMLRFIRSDGNDRSESRP